MFYIVTENVEIVLDGKTYLLEKGDKIVVEDLGSKARQKLAKKFGPVSSVEDYWETIDTIRKYVKELINNARKEQESASTPLSRSIESKIRDGKDFMDKYLDDFVYSLADPQTKEQIEQDRRNRAKTADRRAEVEKSVQDSKREREKELIKAFGESPRQAIERLRKRKTKDRLFESIAYLSSRVILPSL